MEDVVCRLYAPKEKRIPPAILASFQDWETVASLDVRQFLSSNFECLPCSQHRSNNAHKSNVARIACGSGGCPWTKSTMLGCRPLRPCPCPPAIWYFAHLMKSARGKLRPPANLELFFGDSQFWSVAWWNSTLRFGCRDQAKTKGSFECIRVTSPLAPMRLSRPSRLKTGWELSAFRTRARP